ncbi:Ankyrin repeat and zinc finger domain-containing protein 1 [Allomyces javanicus]|nr:Ankyrin repeat and zinc finger domain-containing protein 1 [Allomyces javanicus]
MSATNESTTTPTASASPGRSKKQAADPTASGHFPSTWSLFTFPFLARITPADLTLADVGSTVATADDRAVTPPGPDALAESSSDESDQDKDDDGKDDDAAHFTCQVCAQRFADLIAQRHHFRSLWHRYNVKRVAQLGLAPVDENEFDQQYRDAERAVPAATAATAAKIRADSDSEPDSDNDDADTAGPVDTLAVLFQRAQLEAAPSGPAAATTDAASTDVRTAHTSRTYLRFQLASHPTRTFSVHRTILPSTNPLTTSDTVLAALRTTQSAYRAVYLMLGGGHFAGAVFDRDQCIAHTSIHRYTTRRKQGGAQSSQDSKRHAKSAGANLRRYNEAALAREVWEIMAKWRTHLEAAHAVFVVAPGVANRRVVLGNEVAKEVFAKDDARVKSVPFTTKKPTHSEIVQIHRRLTSVQVVVPEEVEVPAAAPAVVPAAAPTTLAPAPAPVPAPSEPVTDAARLGKKKKKRPATAKTGTQAQAASSSGGENDTSGDEAPVSAPSGPQTLAGRPAPSLVPVGLRQSLASAALSPELRLTAERERRARAAERRMGVLTAASTPSMQSPAAPAAAAVEAPTGCAGCGGAIAKMPIKRHGRQFCSMKCATKFKP